MAAAYSIYGLRIAPVFDVAPEIAIAGGNGSDIRTVSLSIEQGIEYSLSQLKELGVATLICGAISWEFQEFLENHGIAVIPFIAGDLKTVMRDFQAGKDIRLLYAMPGCRYRGCGKRSRYRRRGNTYARFRRNRP